MRVHFRLVLLTLVLNAILWGALPLERAPIAAAQGTCPAVHVVQPGEWLALIARRYGTTVAELIRLNPWLAWNPNLVFVGSRLCIPAPLEHSLVTLEAEYQYIPIPDDKIFELHTTTWQFGKRVVLPLQTIDGVEFVTETTKLAPILDENPPPVLVALSNEVLPNPQTYTLYEVYQGSGPKILPTLQISTTRAITIAPGFSGATLLETLQVGNATAVTATLWLEAADGVQMPFAITRLGMIPSNKIGVLKDDERLALFLLPATTGEPGEYRLKARLSENGIGPDGSQIRWGLYYNYGGWGYYFLRNYYRWGGRNR